MVFNTIPDMSGILGSDSTSFACGNMPNRIKKSATYMDNLYTINVFVQFVDKWLDITNDLKNYYNFL